MNCPPFLDGGQCEIGVESTVIDLTAHSPSILRIGPISKSAIEEVLGTEIQSKTGQKEKKIDMEKFKDGEKNFIGILDDVTFIADPLSA